MAEIYLNGVLHDVQIGERLMDVLNRGGLAADHPCGGMGTCRKCTVLVDDREVLACQYYIRGGERVIAETAATILAAAPTVADALPSCEEDCDLVLDIGTTTLAMGAVTRADGKLSRVVTANNPQRAYGADVMSRIAYAATEGTDHLTADIRAEIAHMVTALGVHNPGRLLVAGNTTMLHLFLGVDPSPMGVAPYTPAFLGEVRTTAAACGLDGLFEVICLPSMAAFVGADLVAGLHHVGLPEGKGYRLLIDLGTNAEILLFSRDRVLCTAAAAGPCFEGASIFCGMAAVEGAITAYEPDGTCDVLGNGSARGLCGTGLVDAVAALLETGVIDDTGYMDCGVFYLAEDVCLRQADVRQFQLAKAAICGTLKILLGQAGITEDEVEHVYIAGGFAARMRPAAAARTGLLPPRLAARCTALGNACLEGLVKYVRDGGDPARYAAMSRYVDPSADPGFQDAFMDAMMFP